MKNNLIFFLLLFFTIVPPVFSASDYVLPYPSSMPGSKGYMFDQVQEKLSPLWHFGDFGSFKNNLYYADKYIVEAKVLFEYNQYLLATVALRKSDSYFSRLENNLNNASQNGKDITQKREILMSASQKHVDILTDIASNTPEDFLWVPEDNLPTKLHIHTMIEESLHIRRQ